MSTPKLHHFVPRMLLRRFVDDEGMLHFYDRDRPNQGVSVSTPANLLAETHLYSQKRRDGSRDVSVETKLALLEGRTSPIIDEIERAIAQQRAPILKQDDRATIVEFLYAQWRRVPDFHNTIKARVNFEEELTRSMDEFERLYRPISVEERQMFLDPSYLERVKKESLPGTMERDSRRVLGVLASRGLGYAVPAQRSGSFIISSFPVAKLTAQSPELDNLQTEVWLPLSSRVALCSYGGFDGKVIAAPPAMVRSLNRGLSKQSRFIAGRSPRLIASLAAPR